MSDEPKKQTKGGHALPATLLAIAVLVAYQGAHYATATSVVGATCAYDTHQIGGIEFRPWANSVFWPAEKFDELIGVSAWGSR